MNVASKLTQSAVTHAIIAGSVSRHAMTPVLRNNLQTIYSKKHLAENTTPGISFTSDGLFMNSVELATQQEVNSE